MARNARWLAAAALLAVLAAPAVAAAQSGSRQWGGGLERLSRRIAAGAAMLRSVSRSGATDRFDDRARRFAAAVERGRGGRLDQEWRAVREAFAAAQQARGDDRVDFLLAHLGEDVAAVDREIAGGAAAGGSGSSGGGLYRARFVQSEVCIGTNRVGPRPCPAARETLTFRLPRDARVVRKIDAVWRDHGRGAKAQVYVDDRFVWETDVAKDWDPDGRELDLRVGSGSTITVRSTGDPVWLRSLDVEYER